MKLTIRDKYFDVVLEKDYDSFEEAEVLLDNCARYGYQYEWRDSILNLPIKEFNNETVAY